MKYDNLSQELAVGDIVLFHLNLGIVTKITDRKVSITSVYSYPEYNPVTNNHDGDCMVFVRKSILNYTSQVLKVSDGVVHNFPDKESARKILELRWMIKEQKEKVNG